MFAGWRQISRPSPAFFLRLTWWIFKTGWQESALLSLHPNGKFLLLWVQSFLAMLKTTHWCKYTYISDKTPNRLHSCRDTQTYQEHSKLGTDRGGEQLKICRFYWNLGMTNSVVPKFGIWKAQLRLPLNVFRGSWTWLIFCRVRRGKRRGYVVVTHGVSSKARIAALEASFLAPGSV